MEQWWQTILDYLQGPQAAAYLRALVKIGVGLILARVAGRGLVRMFAGQDDPHRAMVLQRASFYGIAGLFTASALTEVGFDLSVLIGAAGILTVAIGFASQTSASNIISGLFLLGERPFAVGDLIKVGGTVGEVLSIDLLSVKLRTLDNLYVRLPNETLIKSEVTNIRHFPVRRVDLMVGVAYREDMRQVRNVLLEVADDNPLCLEEPAPRVLFQGYGDSALNHEFRIWTKTENFLDLRDSISVEIKEAFDAHDIEIPFPHRTIYTGSETEPFPVQQTNSPATSSDPQPRPSQEADPE